MTGGTAHGWSTDGFDALAATHRPALVAHCYRMLGSIDDAEDAVQETFARAWRSRDTYRVDTSARAWLYRIATNASLDAIERRRHATGTVTVSPIAPVPEALFADVSAEPHARYDVAESVSMAFLAALQLLTPTQRAVLILRDVLGWRAAEVASLLELGVPAVNSSLHRARLAVASATPPARRTEPARTSGSRALLERYVRAWETADISGLVALLREDAVVSMPPGVTVEGAASIGRFLADVVFADERHVRLRPVDTNGGPGYLIESRSRDYPEFGPYAIVLLGIDDSDAVARIASMTVYVEPATVVRFATS